MIVGSATVLVLVQDAQSNFSVSDIGAVNQITSLLKVKNVVIVVREQDAEATSSAMEVYAVLLNG